MMKTIGYKFKYRIGSVLKFFITPLVDKVIYSIPYGGYKIRLKGGLDFLTVFCKPSSEETFLSRLSLTGKHCYDLGSHIGVLTIFLGQSVGREGRVFSFEPNPETFIRVTKNVQLNKLDNIKMFNIGIGERQETKPLVVRKYYSGSGSMDEKIWSDIVSDGQSKEFKVRVESLDGFIAVEDLPKPDFIKIDIEGLEYQALMGMKETLGKHKPALYIEIHGSNEDDKIENIKKIKQLVESYNYKIYHVESGRYINDENFAEARSGHIYCECNGEAKNQNGIGMCMQQVS